jgi:hypothetical protein
MPRIRAGRVTLAVAIMLLGTPSCAGEGDDPLRGEFVVVALRRASDVHGGPDPGRAAEWLGTTVSFDERLAWLGGVACERWTPRETTSPPVALADPNLSDLRIGPVGGPNSVGERRIDRAFDLFCGEKRVGSLLLVDRRVAVAPSANGLLNLILERPLTAEQIRRLQTQLKDMKFYSGEPTGRLDEATLRGVALYADYRGADYAFARPAITENLLDALGVVP